MKTILTNNPLVRDTYPDLTRFIDVDVAGVFCAVRDEVHKGATVITHPLSGSVKPNESPYKSVIVFVRAGPLDFKSLQLIENAIDMIIRLPVLRHRHDDRVLADYSIIDLELINSAFLGE